MSNATDLEDARALMDILGDSGAKVVSYIGAKGNVLATGYIDQEMDYAGIDGQTPQLRSRASLLVADVGTPRRGDFVIDEENRSWVLISRIPGEDPAITDWYCESK